jgi:hypothetical protein
MVIHFFNEPYTAKFQVFGRSLWGAEIAVFPLHELLAEI